jgi:thymidylate synthase ThyX
MIKAEIVADSLNPQGDRLTSLLITFPRIILAEINTHRMLSKNTSSSRAIPFNKMVESVQNDPFIPIAWQKEHKGMQGSDYITDEIEIEECKRKWLNACNRAINSATVMHSSKITKQLCNRLLEPFMWTTMLITGSKEGWDNFHSLRNPIYEIDLDNLDKLKDV